MKFRVLIPFTGQSNRRLALSYRLIPRAICPTSTCANLASYPNTTPVEIIRKSAITLSTIAGTTRSVSLRNVSPVTARIALHHCKVSSNLRVHIPVRSARLLLIHVRHIYTRIENTAGEVSHTLEQTKFRRGPEAQTSRGDPIRHNRSTAVAAGHLGDVLTSFSTNTHKTSGGTQGKT